MSNLVGLFAPGLDIELGLASAYRRWGDKTSYLKVKQFSGKLRQSSKL